MTELLSAGGTSAVVFVDEPGAGAPPGWRLGTDRCGRASLAVTATVTGDFGDVRRTFGYAILRGRGSGGVGGGWRAAPTAAVLPSIDTQPSTALSRMAEP